MSLSGLNSAVAIVTILLLLAIAAHNIDIVKENIEPLEINLNSSLSSPQQRVLTMNNKNILQMNKVVNLFFHKIFLTTTK